MSITKESLKTALEPQLKYHEGLELKAYRDTVGILTIGIGHNLEANPALSILGRRLREGDPITEAEAIKLFNEDVDKVITQVSDNVPKFATLSQNRQQVLVDMAFNMGISRLLKFGKMWAAISQDNFVMAAAEMLNSGWALQVKSRAKRLALMMKEDLSFEEARRRIS
jgi:lysozyme